MKATLFAAFAVAVSWCVPAEASPTMIKLLETIKETGTSIVADDPNVCKDLSTLGHYVYEKDVVDQLTLCIKNHKGDSAELYDTILHEAVHVVQACNGRPIHSLTSLLKADSGEEVAFIKDSYPPDKLHKELEARIIARDQDEVFVTNLIKEHCK